MTLLLRMLYISEHFWQIVFCSSKNEFGHYVPSNIANAFAVSFAEEQKRTVLENFQSNGHISISSLDLCLQDLWLDNSDLNVTPHFGFELTLFHTFR